MSFNYEIIADPSKALAATKQVEEANERISGSAVKATDAMKQMSSGNGDMASSWSQGLSTLAEKWEMVATAFAGAEIAHELIDLGNEYINLSNSALKFVDATHDVNAVLSDQFELSKELHGGLDQTMEIYDAIRDGTDDLNLSYEDQIRLTRSIGEEVQLSGRSLDSAGGLMTKLSYAFASGTISGRELKGIMKEFPDIATLWTTELGHTRKELQDMANSGKLSVTDLMNTFTSAGEDIDSKFSKRAETTGQAWQHMKDQMALSIGSFIESSGAIKSIGSAIETVSGLIKGLGEGIAWVSDKWDKFKHLLPHEQLKDLVGVLQGSDETVRHLQESLGLVTAATIQYDKELEKTNALIREYPELASEQLSAYEKVTMAMQIGAKRIADAQQFKKFGEAALSAIAELGNEAAQFGGKWELASTKINKFTHELTEDEKILNRLRGPMEEQSRGIAAIGRLYGDGKISLEEYNNEYERLLKLTGSEYKTPSVTGGAMISAVPEMPSVANATKVAEANNLAAQIAETNAAWQKNLRSGDYEEWQQKATDGLSGIDRGLKQIQADTMDIGKTLESALVGGMQEFNKSIVDAATTGKLNFSNLFDFIERKLAEIALQELEMGLIKMIAGGAAGGAGGAIAGHATGGSWTVGGSGGTDTSLQMFRATPGERVTVETPEQQAAARATGNLNVKVVNQHDPRALLDTMDSPEGERVIMNTIRRNEGPGRRR